AVSTIREKRSLQALASPRCLALADPIVQWPRTPPFHGGNTGSNPVRVAGYSKCFILSHLYRSQLGDFIILLTVSLRYPLKSTVSKPTSEILVVARLGSRRNFRYRYYRSSQTILT